MEEIFSAVALLVSVLVLGDMASRQIEVNEN
jgi:hypothetical protein